MDLKINGTDKLIQVSDDIFSTNFNKNLVHQAIVTYIRGSHQRTKAQKTRSEVSGSGKKPWRQKGTGRARAGTIRSPIWRGGGVTFAARRNRKNKKFKLNKQMYRAAMRCVLSELLRLNKIFLVQDFILNTHKTSDLIFKLKTLNLKCVLIIQENIDNNLYLASRNVKKVDVRDVNSYDLISLIVYDKILITISALKKIEEILGC